MNLIESKRTPDEHYVKKKTNHIELKYKFGTTIRIDSNWTEPMVFKKYIYMFCSQRNYV